MLGVHFSGQVQTAIDGSPGIPSFKSLAVPENLMLLLCLRKEGARVALLIGVAEDVSSVTQLHKVGRAWEARLGAFVHYAFPDLVR